MSDLVQRFEALKKKKETLSQKEIESKTVLRGLKADYEAKIAELKETFSLSDIKEAKALKESKEKELEKSLAELEAALSQYEGQGEELRLEDVE